MTNLPITATDEINIKDFTRKPRKSFFRIDDDVFQIRTKRSLPLLQSLVHISKNMKTVIAETGDYEAILEIFDKVLVPASARVLRERVMSEDEDEAIDVEEQLVPIMHYILEEFGIRPTQPSSDSSAGSSSETDGSSSTAGSSSIMSTSTS